MKKQPKRLCRVYRNKVFFYGDLAIKVENAIKLSGLTSKQWFDKVFKNSIKYLKYEQ